MNSLETQYLAKPFSHIYIEDDALNYEITGRILSHFPGANIIHIKHYKDIFNRSKQDFLTQKYAQSLILAVNKGELLYKGARFCQSFDNEYFYYTSNVMNCIYDCEYCYLQGMYPSGNMVIFVNLEDYFNAIEETLKLHSMYICISYDTDLLAIENITGITQKYIDLTNKYENLKIEIRTKSAFDISQLKNINNSRVIFAWTLSPDFITDNFEHRTPSLHARIKAVKNAIMLNANIRLCFDPMIYVKEYKSIYALLYKEVFDNINAENVMDVSLGLFRISSEYIKSMRKKRQCEITLYPYSNTDNICSYEQKKSDEMLNFARLEISKYYPDNRIYTI